MATLAELKARAEKAQQEFERAREALFSSDGQPKFGPAAHRERLGALEQQRTAALAEVLEERRLAVSGAEREIAALEDGDPAALLSAEELVAASARRGFASDDVWALSADDLGPKLRAVLAGGDRAAIFAYWRAALGRHDALGQPQELAEVIGEMRDAVAGPARVAKVGRARQTLAEAGAVEMFVGRLKSSGARTAGAAWMNRRFGAA